MRCILTECIIQSISFSKEKIAKKKKVLQQTDADDGGSISANDIIMSCLCEMCGSSDIFAFDRSVRGIKEGVSKSSAGNFFWEIPFEREHGTNPFEIRNILSSDEGSYFATDGIPLMPFLNGRVGRITSLASITRHQTTFPGTESICQFPSASFIKVGDRCVQNTFIKATVDVFLFFSAKFCVPQFCRTYHLTLP